MQDIDRVIKNLQVAVERVSREHPTDREYQNHFATEVAPYNHRTLVPSQWTEEQERGR